MTCLNSEIRKLEKNRNDQGQNTKTSSGTETPLSIRLFRISIFGFRIFSRWISRKVLGGASNQ